MLEELLNELAYVPVRCPECDESFLVDLHIEDWWRHKHTDKKMALMRAAQSLVSVPETCPYCGSQMDLVQTGRTDKPLEPKTQEKREYFDRQFMKHKEKFRIVPTFKDTLKGVIP